MAVFTLTMGLCRIVDGQYFVLVSVAVNLLIVVFFVLSEHFIPYKKDWLENKGDVKADAIQTFLVLPTASKISELVLPFLFYYPILWMSNSTSYSLSYLVKDLNFFVLFVVVLMSCEFFYYWFHRACHIIPVFWRFHAVHHGAARVYWLNAGRFHFVEAFFSSMIYFLPIAFFQPPAEIIVLIISVSAVTGFLEHVNVDFKGGYLNYIFNTAQLHRWHHSKVVRESNKNYGKVLVFWDLLFFTFFLPKEREVEKVGIVEDDVPIDIVGQLKYPFIKKS